MLKREAMAIRSIKYLSKLLLLFLIAFEGAFGLIQIAGSSFPRLIQGIFFIFLFKEFIKDNNQNEVLFYINKLFFIFAILLALRLFTVTFIQGQYEFNIIIDFVRIFSIVIYTYLTYYLLKQDLNNLNIILLLNSFIMLVAFFQSNVTPLTDFAWDVRNNYFPMNTIGYEDNITFRKRVTGVYTTSIPLAYVLTTNMILSMYMFIKTKFNLYVIYFIFLGAIAVFSQTRSVFLSWIVLSIYLIYLTFFKLTIFKKILLVIFMIFTTFYAMNTYIKNQDKLDRITSIHGASAEGRLPLAVTGLYTIIKHPFGVSKVDYNEAKKEMYAIYHMPNILQFSSHNGLINVGFKYTLLGIFVFIYFVFYIRSILRESSISKEMRLFFLVGVIAYFANSLFHNAFIVIDDFYGLILLAIIAYEYSLGKEKNAKN